MENYEVMARETLYKQERSSAVVFTWLENKINELNDSHKEQADKLRKVLEIKESALQEKINQMPFYKVAKKIFGMEEN